MGVETTIITIEALPSLADAVETLQTYYDVFSTIDLQAIEPGALTNMHTNLANAHNKASDLGIYDDPQYADLLTHVNDLLDQLS